MKLWKTCRQKERQQTKTKEASNLKALRNTIYFKFNLYQSNSLDYKILLNSCSNGKNRIRKVISLCHMAQNCEDAKHCDKKS